MSEALRAFVAVPLPEGVRAALAAEQQTLRDELPGARWTRPAGIHLTLHFLGDVAPDVIEALGGALGEECAAVAPFELAVGGLGVFPGPRRPRVLWAGVAAPEGLQDLHRAAGVALRRCGLKPERRRFHPHLTLARFRSRLSRQGLSTLGRILDQEGRGQAGRFRVEAVHLYRSELLPSGARYTVLHEAPLGG